ERVSGKPLGARRISMAYVARDDAEVSEQLELRDTFEDGRADGFSGQWLETAEFLTLEPRISPRIAGALLTYGNGVLDSHRLAVLLSEAAERLGATVRAGEVSGLRRSGSRVTAVEVDGAELACDAAVIAMGP